MVLDLWVNSISGEAAAAFLGRPGYGGVESLFDSDVRSGTSNDQLLAEMDRHGVDRAMLTGALSPPDEEAIAFVRSHRQRLLLAATVVDPRKPRQVCADIRTRFGDRTVDLVRVSPLVRQLPLNHALYYPLYAVCEELGVPVSINVGIPGPRVRSRCQDPVLLEDVLIDFPDLVVVGAHMGHPYEELLVEYMLKWPNLYLSNSAYSARYLHPALIRFMGSSRGRGRVLFASDHPFFPMGRAVEAARDLPLDGESLAEFLGDAAGRLFGATPDGR